MALVSVRSCCRDCGRAGNVDRQELRYEAFLALVRNIVNIVNPEYLTGTVFIGQVRDADTWMIAMLGGISLGGCAAARACGTFQLHGAPAMWSKTFGNSAWKRVTTVFTGGILLGSERI